MQCQLISIDADSETCLPMECSHRVCKIVDHFFDPSLDDLHRASQTRTAGGTIGRSALDVINRRWNEGRTCCNTERRHHQRAHDPPQEGHSLQREGKGTHREPLHFEPGRCIWDNRRRCSSSILEACHCTCDQGQSQWWDVELMRLVSYPVATIRLFRTRIAPTLRFMQLQRRAASSERVMK